MNALAFDFIKQREGCRLDAYQDSAGIWTIGYGSTGRDVVAGAVWTQAQADARLAADVERTEGAVQRALYTADAKALSTGQMAALISLAYNIGTTSLQTSQLFRYAANGVFLEATKEFVRWDHAGGVESKGLLARRVAEAALFLDGSP